MDTYYRRCIKDYTITDSTGASFKLEQGKEYLTSAEGRSPSICSNKPEKGYVTVFSNYWVKVPVGIFAGKIKYT